MTLAEIADVASPRDRIVAPLIGEIQSRCVRQQAKVEPEVK